MKWYAMPDLEVVMHLDVIGNVTAITHEQYHALYMTKWFLILGSLLKTMWSGSWGRASWVRGSNSEYWCPGKGTVIIIWCWNYQDRPFTTRLHWTVLLKCLHFWVFTSHMHVTHPFQCLRMLSPRFQAPLYILFSNLEINSLDKADGLRVNPHGQGSGRWGGVGLRVASFLKLYGFQWYWIFETTYTGMILKILI